MDNQIVHQKLCAVEGCENKKHSRTYCGKHHYKFKLYGDPLAGKNNASPGDAIKWIDANKNHDGDECLIWPYEITHHGYGTVSHNGKKRVASRVMCEFAHGEPESIKMDAAHSCGNGKGGCVNPKHLRWATRKENNSDKILHGTHRNGEQINFAVLTEAQVESIILMKGKVSQRKIAVEFGISQSNVSRIHAGIRWAHLSEGTNERKI